MVFKCHSSNKSPTHNKTCLGSVAFKRDTGLKNLIVQLAQTKHSEKTTQWELAGELKQPTEARVQHA